MAATPTPTPEDEYIEAVISDIDRSQNYRHTYTNDDIADIGTSIRARGVIHAIVVRPAAEGAGHKWRLIAGERRIRGSIFAERTTIPAVVKHGLSDAEARAIGLVENLQRRTVDPIEEADAFRELHEVNKWPVDKIATETGQSKTYVYARIRLCALVPAGRKAYHAGKIDLSVAMLASRIPSPDIQKQYVEQVTSYGYPIAHDMARRILDEHFMRRLDMAPFDVKDDKLVAGTGTCAACPKRTGNQAELFADVKSGDVCTDTKCYAAKAEATWRARASVAERTGIKILDDKKAAELFPHSGALSHASPYVEAGAKCYADKKQRTFEKIAVSVDPSGAAPLVIARDPLGGIHTLIAKKDLAPFLAAAGIEAAGNPAAEEDRKRRKKAKEDADRRRAVTSHLIADIVGRANQDGAKPRSELWRVVVLQLLDRGFHDAANEVVKARGWAVKGKSAESIIEAKMVKLPAEHLPAMVLELILSAAAFGVFATGETRAMKAAIKAYDVDRKAIAKVARVGEDDKPAKVKVTRGRKERR